MTKLRFLVPLCVVAAAVIGLATFPSGAQDVRARITNGEDVLIVQQPVASADGAPALHTLRVERLADGGPDEESRQLHQKDREQEQSTRQLLAQYRDAESGGDRSEILDKLNQAVREQFEVRQQLRAKELEALEARLRKLREMHDKREQAKNEIVERRVEQLVREAEGLGWTSGGDGPGHPGLFFSHPVPPPGAYAPAPAAAPAAPNRPAVAR